MSTVAPTEIKPNKVELILAQLDSLPPLAPVVLRIMSLAGDSQSNEKELVALINGDPLLTAHVLAVSDRAESLSQSYSTGSRGTKSCGIGSCGTGVSPVVHHESRSHSTEVPGLAASGKWEDSGSDTPFQTVKTTGETPVPKLCQGLSASKPDIRREVATVEEAVATLGFDVVRRLTVAFKVMEVFGGTPEPPDSNALDRSAFWKHCIGVACAARRIAMTIPTTTPPEEAFMAGLLHDIGKEAINATIPKSFARILRKCDESCVDMPDVERAILGVDHTVVGHRLARRLGLPQRLVEAVWLHHHTPEALPPSVAPGMHVQIVQLADALAREQRIGDSGNPRVQIPSRELAEGLGLTEPQRLAILVALEADVTSHTTWIGADGISNQEIDLREVTRSMEALTKQNRRLERKAEYFAAMDRLNRSAAQQGSVRELCGVCAETVRQALSVSAVLVFVTSEDGHWVETGFSDGTLRSEILERQPDAPDETSDTTMAVQLAAAGTWIGPPGRAVEALIDHHRGTLGEGSVRLLPLIHEQRWVGGALFSTNDSAVAGLRGESKEIAALSAAVALAIVRSQSQTAAIALSDELAEVNRRLSRTQSELLHTKTLEAVADMAAGAAHELNNPLAVISARAQMLRDRTDDAEVRTTLDTIAKQAHDCSDIVTELLDFARMPEPEREEIHLGVFLDALMTELISTGLLDAPAISVEVPSDTPPVRFDRSQLSQMFRELLQNGIDATEPATRRLTVKAASDLTEESVVVVVADNGRGMASEVLSRAMGPFFSHRPAGRGRGLGLARVHRWLQCNGAAIRIESNPGEGTAVELRLPTPGGSNH